MSPPSVDKWIRIRGVTVENRTFHLPPEGMMVVSFPGPPLWKNGNFLNAGKPTRIKVPAGLSGRYLARATVHWFLLDDGTFSIQARDGSYFFSRLRLNGDTSHDPREARTTTAPIVQATITSQSILWETNLTSGNYLELEVKWHAMNQAARDAVSGLKLDAWLTLRRLGKPA